MVGLGIDIRAKVFGTAHVALHAYRTERSLRIRVVVNSLMPGRVMSSSCSNHYVDCIVALTFCVAYGQAPETVRTVSYLQFKIVADNRHWTFHSRSGLMKHSCELSFA